MNKQKILRIGSLIIFVFILTLVIYIRKNKNVKVRSNINLSYLVFKEDRYDFGIIDGMDKNNEVISKDFIFTNISDKTIKITGVDPSCNCVSAELPHQPILAGKNGIVKILINTKKISGTFYNQIFVLSDIKDYKWLLRVRGFIDKHEGNTNDTIDITHTSVW